MNPQAQEVADALGDDSVLRRRIGVLEREIAEINRELRRRKDRREREAARETMRRAPIR